MVSFPSEMFNHGRKRKSSKTPTGCGRDSGWGLELRLRGQCRPEWVERLANHQDGRQEKSGSKVAHQRCPRISSRRPDSERGIGRKLAFGLLWAFPCQRLVRANLVRAF